jgi:hypothetical protein
MVSNLDHHGNKTLDLTSEDAPPAEGERDGNAIGSGEDVDASLRVFSGEASLDEEMNGYGAENTATEGDKEDAPPSVLTTDKDSGCTRASPSESSCGNLEMTGEAEADNIEHTRLQDPKGLSSLDEKGKSKNERKRLYKGSNDLGDSDGNVDTDDDNSSVGGSKRARMDEPTPPGKKPRKERHRWDDMYSRLVVYKVMVSQAGKSIGGRGG